MTPGSSRRATGTVVSESQVEAMISLLTDESEVVVDSCRQALLGCVEVAEPLLRERLAQVEGVGEQDDSPVAQATSAGSDSGAIFREVLEEIGFSRVSHQLVKHLAGEPDLEAGSILIGRLVDGGAAPEGVSAVLDVMADQVQAGLAEGDREPLAVLTEVLVNQNGVTGIDPMLAGPIEALVHGVTTLRQGIPLPVSIVWILVARRCGLPLVGVNMPGHFIVRYDRETTPLFLDPFRSGEKIREERCRGYLEKGGFPNTDPRLLNASDRDMLVRTLHNLIMIARRQGKRSLERRCAHILRKAKQIGSGA